MARPSRKQRTFIKAYAAGYSFQQACELAGLDPAPLVRLTFFDKMWREGWLSVTVTDAGKEAVEKEDEQDRRVD